MRVSPEKWCRLCSVATQTEPSAAADSARTPSVVRPSSGMSFWSTLSDTRSSPPPRIPTQMLPSMSSNSDRGEPPILLSYAKRSTAGAAPPDGLRMRSNPLAQEATQNDPSRS